MTAICLIINKIHGFCDLFFAHFSIRANPGMIFSTIALVINHQGCRFVEYKALTIMLRFTSGNLLAHFLILTVLLVGAGCKSKLKIAEQESLRVGTENARQAKEILLSILNDNGQMTLEEKELKYEQAKKFETDDPEVKDLMAQVEAQLARERDSLPPANQKEVIIDETTITLKQRVLGLMNGVADASSISGANQLINENLNLFTSPDALVLIIISKSGEIKDYDEPTTIMKYLNYVKDQKNNPNKVFDLVLDESGKIKEVELIRK